MSARWILTSTTGQWPLRSYVCNLHWKGCAIYRYKVEDVTFHCSIVWDSETDWSLIWRPREGARGNKRNNNQKGLSNLCSASWDWSQHMSFETIFHRVKKDRVWSQLQRKNLAALLTKQFTTVSLFPTSLYIKLGSASSSYLCALLIS